MKRVPILISCLFLTIAGFSQQQGVNPPNVNIDGRPLVKKKVSETSRHNVNIDSTESTIIIINERIYSERSPEFRKLKQKDIQSIELIADDSTKTRINKVLIIKTKPV